jgi:hypothetical protein
MPRMTALHMLRSTISTVSAPANSSFRGSITHPTQPLCTLRVRRYRRLTQHSLPGDLLGLTWAGLAPADRASFAWRLHLFDHLGLVDQETLLVSLCDKIHNARAILRDLRKPQTGKAVWDRFKASRKDTLWYYRELAKSFQKLLKDQSAKLQLADELGEIVDMLERA